MFIIDSCDWGGKSRLLLEIWEELVGQLESRGWFLEEIPLLRELSFCLISLSGLGTPSPNNKSLYGSVWAARTRSLGAIATPSNAKFTMTSVNFRAHMLPECTHCFPGCFSRTLSTGSWTLEAWMPLPRVWDFPHLPLGQEPGTILHGTTPQIQ